MLDAMSLTQPGSGGSTLAAAFDAARAELKDDVRRGAGGRGALETIMGQVDDLSRDIEIVAGQRDDGDGEDESA